MKKDLQTLSSEHNTFKGWFQTWGALGINNFEGISPSFWGELEASAKNLHKNKDTERPLQDSLPYESSQPPSFSLLQACLPMCLRMTYCRYGLKRAIETKSCDGDTDNWSILVRIQGKVSWVAVRSKAFFVAWFICCILFYFTLFCKLLLTSAMIELSHLCWGSRSLFYDIVQPMSVQLRGQQPSRRKEGKSPSVPKSHWCGANKSQLLRAMDHNWTNWTNSSGFPATFLKPLTLQFIDSGVHQSHESVVVYDAHGGWVRPSTHSTEGWLSDLSSLNSDLPFSEGYSKLEDWKYDCNLGSMVIVKGEDSLLWRFSWTQPVMGGGRKKIQSVWST